MSIFTIRHPSRRFDVNSNHFQLAMLAYNLNCWLMLFNREPQANATALRHTTLATSRLRFLFVARKSGAMLAALERATAITTRRRVCSRD
jgi:hypothetical protein